MGGGISLNLQSSAQPAPASVNESVSIAPEQLAAQASCLSNLEAVTRQTARKGPPGSFTIDQQALEESAKRQPLQPTTRIVPVTLDAFEWDTSDPDAAAKAMAGNPAAQFELKEKYNMDNMGTKLLYNAKNHNYENLGELVTECFADSPERGNKLTYPEAAAKHALGNSVDRSIKGDSDELKEFLAQDPPRRFVNSVGTPTMVRCCREGTSASLQLLLANGYPVNMQNPRPRQLETPLHTLAENDYAGDTQKQDVQLDMAKQLLAAGASMELRDADERSPLQLAEDSKDCHAPTRDLLCATIKQWKEIEALLHNESVGVDERLHQVVELGFGQDRQIFAGVEDGRRTDGELRKRINPASRLCLYDQARRGGDFGWKFTSVSPSRPAAGTEIINEKLAEALKARIEANAKAEQGNQEELHFPHTGIEEWGVVDMVNGSYINVEENFYRADSQGGERAGVLVSMLLLPLIEMAGAERLTDDLKDFARYCLMSRFLSRCSPAKKHAVAAATDTALEKLQTKLEAMQAALRIVPYVTTEVNVLAQSDVLLHQKDFHPRLPWLESRNVAELYAALAHVGGVDGPEAFCNLLQDQGSGYIDQEPWCLWSWVYLDWLLALARKVNPAFQSSMRRLFGPRYQAAPVKTKTRVRAKLAADFGAEGVKFPGNTDMALSPDLAYKAGTLLDYVRGAVVCSIEADVVEGIKALDAHFRVVRIKNLHHHDATTVSGYRDVKVFVVYPVLAGGTRFHMICEVQLLLAGFSVVKESMHLLYGMKRGDFD